MSRRQHMYRHRRKRLAYNGSKAARNLRALSAFSRVSFVTMSYSDKSRRTSQVRVALEALRPLLEVLHQLVVVVDDRGAEIQVLDNEVMVRARHIDRTHRMYLVQPGRCIRIRVDLLMEVCHDPEHLCVRRSSDVELEDTGM